ncbi:MAG: hypothetical protein JWO69_1129 [Thermoleophilia bacterium]|nr:hypothetical protein [Thermoleophilia bacterium]
MASNPTSQVHVAPAAAGHTLTPAPLSSQEADILRRILAGASFDGAAELLDQVRMLQLLPASDTTSRFYVLHGDAPRSSYSPDARAKLPEPVAVRRPDGRVVGHFHVWVDHGHLRALQYTWAGERAPMTLPSPEWVGAPAVVPAVVPATAQRRRLPAAAMVLVTLIALALAAGAFAFGHASGADVDAARATGEQAGRDAGAVDGTVEGTFRGATEGAIAGRASTYQPAFDAARAEVEAAARTAARQARVRAAAAAKAAAAAAVQAPTNIDNTSCSGFRDARGYWICS